MKHEEIIDLLPWFATGALEEGEAATVRDHVADCAECTHEVAQLSLIHGVVAEEHADEPAYDPAILQRALAQIDAQTAVSPQERGGLFASIAGKLQWSITPLFARVAIGAQLAVVLGLVVVLARPDADDGAFSTASKVEGPAIMVSFDAAAAHSDVNAFLLDLDVEITGGPDALGILRITPVDPVQVNVDEKIAELRDKLEASGLTTYTAVEE